MNQSGLSAFPYLKPSIKSKPQLHTALLMNPQEVDLAFKADMVDARHLVLGHWLLTGAVNQELFAKLQVDAGKTTFASLEILCTPAGAAYASHLHELWCVNIRWWHARALACSARGSLSRAEPAFDLYDGLLMQLRVSASQKKR